MITDPSIIITTEKNNKYANESCLLMVRLEYTIPETEKIIRNTIILCIRTENWLYILIFINNNEHINLTNWYRIAMTKYDENSQIKIYLTCVSKIRNSDNAIQISDIGKRNKDEWVILISAKVHNDTPKIKDINET